MVQLSHAPEQHVRNFYIISGDNMDELVTYCLQRIREHSKEYYRQELYNDLRIKGVSLIDVHAGMGRSYRVELTGENGCRARAKQFLLARLYDPEAVEHFVETNWQWVLGDMQNLEKFEKWITVAFSARKSDEYSIKLLSPDIHYTDPDTLQFCLIISDYEFWYCEFDKAQLIYIPDSIEFKWFHYYKGSPCKLVNDAKENIALKRFINVHKLWISTTIDVREISEKKASSLFSTYGINPEDLPVGRDRNQMVAEMYFETYIDDFRE